MNVIISKALQENRNLLEPETWRLLQDYGIKLPSWGFAQSTETTLKVAEEIGFPIALKVVSRDIVHKSDVGGVKVNIRDFKTLSAAIQEITSSVTKHVPGSAIEGWMLTKMISNGTEMIIGGARDAQFGTIIMCGLGGVFIELFKDVKMRLAPVNTKEAMEMLQELKAFKLLQGYRGQEPCNIEALVKLIVKVSNLLVDYPQISELDLNPVIVLPQGAFPVDARVIIKEQNHK